MINAKTLETLTHTHTSSFRSYIKNGQLCFKFIFVYKNKIDFNFIKYIKIKKEETKWSQKKK